MATVGIMGPFAGTSALAPGQSVWMDVGESDGFTNCALSVTASAHHGIGGTVHVLKVDDVTITALEEPHNGFPNVSFHMGCNVTNTGETTVERWSLLVGVIVP